MSAPDLHDGEGSPDVLAGEYVLGVLDAPARAAVAARLSAEPELAREVEAWQARLLPLAESIAPVAPPTTLWPAVLAATGAAPTAANDDGAVVMALQRRLGRWRVATAASVAVAAGLAAAVVLPLTTRPPAPPATSAPAPMMMARLAPTAKGAGEAAMFMATFDPTKRELMIAPTASAAHPGHSPELWLIAKGARPAALGMAAFATPVRLVLASDAMPSGPLTLAVSMEPPGGSPTGQPTGPVIAAGELKPL